MKYMKKKDGESENEKKKNHTKKTHSFCSRLINANLPNLATMMSKFIHFSVDTEQFIDL